MLTCPSNGGPEVGHIDPFLLGHVPLPRPGVPILVGNSPFPKTTSFDEIRSVSALNSVSRYSPLTANPEDRLAKWFASDDNLIVRSDNRSFEGRDSHDGGFRIAFAKIARDANCSEIVFPISPAPRHRNDMVNMERCVGSLCATALASEPVPCQDCVSQL